MEIINWLINHRRQNRDRVSTGVFGANEMSQVMAFHRTFPGYSPTPLVNLSGLAAFLGISSFYVKDESHRFGLNAFKALGGSYAIGRYLVKTLGVDLKDLPFEKMKSPEIKERLGNITFTTATDGNHGRGVAWAARELGQKALVFLPSGTAQERYNNIKATGAEVYITDLGYDDTVKLAADNAARKGYVLVQDTAWEGYEEIPKWIMQGYTTMVGETMEQMRQQGLPRPTHVLVQAGVGSFPAAVQGCLYELFGESCPKVAVVEPVRADCIFRSAAAGEAKIVTEEMDTIMAGLACGRPSPPAWEILRDFSEMFFSCPDFVAAYGMRVLGSPLAGDQRVISGESGAVTAGLVTLMMRSDSLKEARQAFGLDGNSCVLVFSTEGDTDPDNYRKVVWDGAYGVTG